MKQVHDSKTLKIFIDLDCLEFCSQRAGNPKSLDISKETPKSIDKLATATPNSGHDCFLKGIVVYFDWTINKIIREQLLRYNFINVISSCSLMHCFEKYQKAGLIDNNIKSVEEIPLGFAYPISFQTNYLQLKTIYNQRKQHKKIEWRDFCIALKSLPNSHWIGD